MRCTCVPPVTSHTRWRLWLKTIRLPVPESAGSVVSSRGSLSASVRSADEPPAVSSADDVVSVVASATVPIAAVAGALCSAAPPEAVGQRAGAAEDRDHGHRERGAERGQPAVARPDRCPAVGAHFLTFLLDFFLPCLGRCDRVTRLAATSR